ncbi:hypothetical protein KIPB_008446 [Kipferlia bialata]|uniref:Nudix hydrolase domain-containing protein n=1 Tax=Kipferlia bialata TaxID=797122 RepID=A0A9K3D002_9EUKA|nr:hypothetical protein KIPB_008446 [Kipferlia bialata]|eukprot:g8446.t1
MSVERRDVGRPGLGPKVTDCLYILGGKAEPADRGVPMNTAAREFWEETGKILPRQRVIDLLKGAPSRYMSTGKYQLFVVPAPPEMLSLHTQFQSQHASADSMECSHIGWVSLPALQAAGSKRGNTIVLTNTGKLTSKWYPISVFLRKVLACRPAQGLLSSVGSTCALSPNEDTLGLVDNEIDHVQALLALSDKVFVDTLFGKQWRLSNKAPPLPPKPTIHSLSKTESQYQDTVDSLPQEIQDRIYDVRSATVPARLAVYQREQQRLGVGERAPLYHGTPEPHRATQIALHGFNLNIMWCR